MAVRLRLLLLGALSMFVTACASEMNTKELVDACVAKMGGAEKIENIRTIVRKGAGTRTMIGQSRSASEAEPKAQLTNLVETIDFVNGRVALEYDFELTGPKQHRKEVYTKHGPAVDRKPIGYQTVNDRSTVVSPGALYGFATYDSPQMAMRRQITEIILAAQDSALTGEVARGSNFDGNVYKHGTAKTKSRESIDLYFDPETKLLAGYQIMDTDAVLGDVPYDYVLSDYRPVDGIPMPHKLKVKKNGKDLAEVQYSSIAIESGPKDDVFEIPESNAADLAKAKSGNFVPMKLTRIAPGVYHAEGFSHNSMVVEFADHVVIVEAPLHEVQAKVLIEQLRKQIPLKTVRYVIPTHLHHDHIGGIRAFVAIGANVLVEQRQENEIRQMIEARHARVRDELQSLRDAPGKKDFGKIEVFQGKKVLADKSRSLELYAIDDSPHAVPIVVAYLPREKLLFESDLYTPGAANAGPAATNLFEALQKLALKPDKLVGGHGSSGPFTDLAKAVKGS